MSQVITKKKIPVSVIASATGSGGFLVSSNRRAWMLLRNAIVGQVERLFIGLRGYNIVVREYNVHIRDIARNSTKTYDPNLQNAGLELDFDDSTRCITGTCNTGETNIATYDFGTNAERYVYALSGVWGAGVHRVYVSSDGTTWTRINEITTPADRSEVKSSVFGVYTFRYLRFVHYTTDTTYCVGSALYSVEVYSTSSPSNSFTYNTTVRDYALHEIATKRARVSVFVESPEPIDYSVYRSDYLNQTIEIFEITGV